jgi:hypothetical protein
MEFVSRWRLLNYDPNSLKVAKLVSEAEAHRREAWAGAKRVSYESAHPNVTGCILTWKFLLQDRAMHVSH